MKKMKTLPNFLEAFLLIGTTPSSLRESTPFKEGEFTTTPFLSSSRHYKFLQRIGNRGHVIKPQ